GVRGQGSGVSPPPAPLPELTPDPWPLTPDVLDLLMKLVDKSLVVYEERGGEGRYRLLETIRQFAREYLAASPESEAIQRQHAGYFMALTEAAEPHLTDPQQQVWLERLEQERDNL